MILPNDRIGSTNSTTEIIFLFSSEYTVLFPSTNPSVICHEGTDPIHVALIHSFSISFSKLVTRTQSSGSQKVKFSVKHTLTIIQKPYTKNPPA